MPLLQNRASSQATSFRLAWRLFLGGAFLVACYYLWPHPSAQYVLPAYFFIHGSICLWAAQEAFAGTGPASGCVPGVALWLVLSIEFMAFSAVWIPAVGGPH